MISFREVYKRIRAFNMKNDEKEVFKTFPNYKNANCFIGYGYIDHMAGFTEEVLCLAKIENEKIEIFEGNTEETLKMRMDTKDIEGYFSNDQLEKDLKKTFKEMIKIIDTNYENKELKALREDEVFDEFRHSEYIDDVLVCFHKDGLKDEHCWVRLEKTSPKGCVGILLNEPNQDFGIHEGNEVMVYNYLNAAGEKILVTEYSAK